MHKLPTYAKAKKKFPLLTRDNSGALVTRRATMRGNEAVVLTPHRVQRQDERGAYYEVIDIASVNLTMPRVPLLNSHRQASLDDVIGGVVLRRENDTIVAAIDYSQQPQHANIVSAIRSGLLANTSSGYRVGRWEESTDAEGNRVRTGFDTVIHEVSIVALGADPNSRIIRELGERAGVETRSIDALIDRGATVEQARSAFFEEMLTRSAQPIRSTHNENSMDNSEAFQRAVGEALFMRGAPNHQPTGAARQYVGHTLLDVARECCRRSGVGTIGFAATTLIERALTTSDFPQILADTVGRTLRASYKQPTSGIRLLARQTTMNDFRARSRMMLESSGVLLEKVNEHGEYKNGSLAEAVESYRLNTYGKIIALTRQAIINDDLGALTDLARRFGVAAMAFEAQELVNLLQANSGAGPTMSDTNPMHHTAHGNVSGSGAAPAENTLSAARLAMRKQTGVGGGLIEVTPRYLLVPSELETAAEKLLSTINAAATADVNVFGGKLQLIVEPRLTSATRWWLFASPDEVEGLEYAHLAGAPGPQITTQVGFRVDGVETKVSLDFGCGAVDWRGSYTNAGA